MEKLLERKQGNIFTPQEKYYAKWGRIRSGAYYGSKWYRNRISDEKKRKKANTSFTANPLIQTLAKLGLVLFHRAENSRITEPYRMIYGKKRAMGKAEVLHKSMRVDGNIKKLWGI